MGRKFDRSILNDDACIDGAASLLVESEWVDIELDDILVFLEECTGVL